MTGFGDLLPHVHSALESGVHNWMTYITGDIPVGAYDPNRLANIGIGHGAIDAGGGYTYFNPQTGHEFSAVLGFTYNFENQDTQYKNGIDMHLDWGASQFLTKQWQIGLVGYFYNQLSCDSGSGDRVGCFKSRVIGVGPQIGLHLPIERRLSGLFEPQGLQGIRRGAPPRRLERVGDARILAGRGKKATRVEAATHREVAPDRTEKPGHCFH